VRAPATYIVTTEDRIIPPRDQRWLGRKGQRSMARNIPSRRIVRLQAGHASPVLYPESLVDLLLALA